MDEVYRYIRSLNVNDDIIATVGGFLCFTRVCVYIVFNYIWGTSKRITTLKISAKYLEKRLFTPVHTFFNIDNSTVGFFNAKKTYLSLYVA